jgi:hypothetical protein
MWTQAVIGRRARRWCGAARRCQRDTARDVSGCRTKRQYRRWWPARPLRAGPSGATTRRTSGPACAGTARERILAR